MSADVGGGGGMEPIPVKTKNAPSSLFQVRGKGVINKGSHKGPFTRPGSLTVYSYIIKTQFE